MNKENLAKYVERVENLVNDTMSDMQIIIEDGLYNLATVEDFINTLDDLICQAIKLQIKLQGLRDEVRYLRWR